jgi:hypothetical protein
MKVPAWVSCALAGAAVLGMGTPALAQDVRKPSNAPNEWENEVAIYFWLTHMAGDAEIQGTNLDVDSDYDDMLKNLTSSVGVHYELWQHDAWGIGADFYRMVLEDDPDLPAGDGELQNEFLTAEATLIGRMRTGQAYLDYFAGVRWMNLETHFESPGVDEDRTRNYVDPIIIKGGNVVLCWFTRRSKWTSGSRRDRWSTSWSPWGRCTPADGQVQPRVEIVPFSIDDSGPDLICLDRPAVLGVLQF